MQITSGWLGILFPRAGTGLAFNVSVYFPGFGYRELRRVPTGRLTGQLSGSRRSLVVGQADAAAVGLSADVSGAGTLMRGQRVATWRLGRQIWRNGVANLVAGVSGVT